LFITATASAPVNDVGLYPPYPLPYPPPYPPLDDPKPILIVTLVLEDFDTDLDTEAALGAGFAGGGAFATGLGGGGAFAAGFAGGAALGLGGADLPLPFDLNVSNP
jgi:hypothetical protein